MAIKNINQAVTITGGLTGTTATFSGDGTFGPYVFAQRFRTTIAGAASFAAIYMNSDADTGLFQPASNNIGFTTGGSEKMRLVSTGELLLGQTSAADAHFVVNSGSWAPNKPLLRLNNGFYNYMFGYHSRQSVSHSFQIYANSTVANINWNSGVLKIGTQTSSSLQFYTAGSDKVTLTAGGNLLIGTTTDIGGKLTIQNNNSGSNTTGIYLKNSSAVNGGISIDFDNSSSNNVSARIASLRTSSTNFGTALTFNTTDSVAISERMRLTSGGNLLIGTTSDNGKKLQVNGDLQVFNGSILVPQGYGINYGQSGYDIKMPSSTRLGVFTASTEKLSVLNNGNVGIGTVNPIDKLNLYDADNNVGIYIQTATSGTSGGDGFRLGLNNAHAFVWNYENTPLSFATNGAQKATILANGNFGIGTTNPSTKLHIVGGVLHLNESGNSAFYGGNYVRVFNDQNYGFRNTGGTTVANISMSGNTYFNGGNVGIGTTAPAVKLDFGANTGKAFHLYTSGADYYGFNMLQYDGGGFSTNIFSGNNGEIKLRTAAGTTTQTTRLTVKANGNIGIGTTNPSTKIVISNSQKGIEMNPTGGTNDNPYIQSYNRSNSSYEDLTIYASNQHFNIGSTNAMTIKNNRNVLIGSTTDNGNKLQVSGIVNVSDGVYMRGANSAAFNGDGTYILDVGKMVNDKSIRTAGNVLLGGSLTGTTGNFSGSLTTGYGVALNGGLVNYLLYGNTGDSNLYLRDMNNSAMISSWSPTAFKVHKNLTVDGTTNLVGNLGIGTTSPGAKLEILQGAGGTAQNVINSAETGFRFSTKVENTSTNTVVFRQGIYHNNTENATIAFFRGSSSVGGFMSFQTQNGNERMRLTAAGNLLIGSTSDNGKKLQISGNSTIYSTGTTDSFPLIVGQANAANNFVGIGLSGFIASNGAVKAAMVLDRDGIFGVGDIHFLNNTTQDNSNATLTDSKLVIKKTGNVLIGTTSDNGGRLVVAAGNTTNVDIASFKNSNAVSKIKLSLDSAGSSKLTMLDSSNNEDVVLSTQGNSYFKGGSVGIGTASPSRELEITGTGNVYARITASTSSDSAALELKNVNELWTLKADDTDADSFKITSDGGTKLKLTTGGNLLLGTTTDSGEKLRVEGNAKINGLSNYSSDYNLIDISSTKSSGSAVTNVKGINLNVGSNDHIASYEITNLYGAYINNSTNGGSASVINKWYGIYIPPADPDRVANRVSAYFGDSVGIGTASPDKLMVISGADAEVAISDTNDTPQVRFRNSGITSAVISIDSSKNMKFQTNGTSEKVRITSGGNVLIGTTTDAGGNRKIQVAGGDFYTAEKSNTAGANAGYGGSSFQIRNGSTSEDLNFDLFNRTSSNWYTPFVIKNTGNVGIGIQNPSCKLMIIDSTSSFSHHKFHVGRGANAGISITDTDATGFIKSIQDENEAGYGNLTLMADDAGNKDGYISFNGSSVERARITAAGNFGIGTTSPLGKLQVNAYTVASQGNQNVHGELSVFANSGAESLFLGIKNAAYPNRGWAFNPVTSGVNSNLQIKEHGASGTRMTIASGGNVGIGTISPQRELHIHASNFTDLQLTNDTTGSGAGDGSTISATGSDLYINNKESANILLYTANTERARITSSGNVGIGTTTPAEKLHVIGNIKTTGQVKGATLVTDTVEIKEDDPTGALVTFTGQGSAAGGEANVGLKLVGTTATNGTIKLKMKAKNSGGTLTGSGTISYNGQFDTMGVGQSTTHNSMAMLINNDANVAIGTSTFASGVRLNVGGSIRLLSGGFQTHHAGGFLIADTAGSNRYGLKFGGPTKVGGSADATNQGNLLALTNRAPIDSHGGGEVSIQSRASASGTNFEVEVARFSATTTNKPLVTLSAALKLKQQNTTPSDPENGSSVIWMASNGDLLVKITSSQGTTVTKTLADFA